MREVPLYKEGSVKSVRRYTKEALGGGRCYCLEGATARQTREASLALPRLGRRTILKLTVLVCSTNPSTLKLGRARADQIASPKQSETELEGRPEKETGEKKRGRRSILLAEKSMSPGPHPSAAKPVSSQHGYPTCGGPV